MIPLIAAVRIGARRTRWIPIPLFLVWLLLLPICILLLPIYFWACRANGIPAGRALWAGWSVLRGLSGTHLDFQHSSASFAVRLI